MKPIDQMNLEDLIAACLAEKHGKKEFLLTKEGDEWCAAIGNSSTHVAIGEIVGYGDHYVDFVATGATPTGVVRELLTRIRGKKSNDHRND